MRNSLIIKVAGIALPLVILACFFLLRAPASSGFATRQKPSAGYAGSNACKACHEDQFANFNRTPHARLESHASWKGKEVGCEQCHGPGQPHIDDPGDATKIISFKNKTQKDLSDAC